MEVMITSIFFLMFLLNINHLFIGLNNTPWSDAKKIWKPTWNSKKMTITARKSIIYGCIDQRTARPLGPTNAYATAALFGLCGRIGQNLASKFIFISHSFYWLLNNNIQHKPLHSFSYFSKVLYWAEIEAW